MWEKILLIFAGLAVMLLLLSLTLNLTPSFSSTSLEGSKQFIVQQLLKRSYECFQKNYPKKESVICYQFTFNCNEAISAVDLLNSLDTTKLSEDKLKAEDLGTNGKIIIRYENAIIYVEKA